MSKKFVNIMDFGAVADGKTINTEAFKSAIEECSKNGGGTVYVPAGKYATGPIHLKSNITLNIDAGAVLLFSNDINDFPIVNSRWEGEECEVYSPLFYGENLENVAIVGRGTLDGQGEYWWKLMSEGKIEYPRPRFISFTDSKNILIEGVFITNSPAWTINPICCENVTVNKVTIKNPAFSPNTDGINPDSCKNVHISNCHIDVGDDCIAIKSGVETSTKRVPCENITITNCTMVHGHGGVVIGSEMSGGVRNIVISNCVFEGTDRGIRIKSRRRRGGFVEDIRVNNIIMKSVICPFILNLYYHCGANGREQYVWDENPYPVDETTPAFRRIHLSNITAREVRACAAFMYGLSEMPVEDITLENITIHMDKDANPAKPAMMTKIEKMKQKGVICRNAKNIRFTNVTVSEHEGPAFDIKTTKGLELAGCKADNSNANDPVIVLESVRDAFIHSSKLDAGREIFIELKGTENKDIELAGNSRNIKKENIKAADGADISAIVM